MRLVEDDDVVEALSPDGADHPFRERILPGRPRCGHNLLNAHYFEPGAGLPVTWLNSASSWLLGPAIRHGGSAGAAVHVLRRTFGHGPL